METDSKLQTIVILTDDKKGHFNQSCSVAQLLPKAHIVTISTQYKSKIHQLILSFLTYAPLPKFLISFFLTQSLKKDSYSPIASTPCDIVISTGASLNAPNLFLSKLKSAKSVVVMKPSWGWKKQYDLQIIPKHDTLSFFYLKRSNVVITLGAPTSIRKEDLKEKAKKLSTHLKLPSQQYISLFIGGNSSHHHLTGAMVHSMVQKINKVAQEKDLNLLITTSRRTPNDVSQVLKNIFSNHPRCPLLIIASETPSQPEDLISGMMGLSELILVTEDSISMISEAASSGKNTIVIQTDFDQKKSKHRHFIQELAQEKYIELAPLPTLDKIMVQKLESTMLPKVLNDSNAIQEALARLL
ncbi:MAG: mitochondrial fission ELM1 family protein [Deltaproteobacteria bacterium]|nr:mitochondrial fission ELM1 family protein [Deltaproteobacteria bacterium]